MKFNIGDSVRILAAHVAICSRMIEPEFDLEDMELAEIIMEELK